MLGWIADLRDDELLYSALARHSHQINWSRQIDRARELFGESTILPSAERQEEAPGVEQETLSSATSSQNSIDANEE